MSPGFVTEELAMELKDFKVGDRVKIHPASDWFMKGIQFATVIHVGHQLVGCTSELHNVHFQIHPRNISEIV